MDKIEFRVGEYYITYFPMRKEIEIADGTYKYVDLKLIELEQINKKLKEILEQE